MNTPTNDPNICCPKFLPFYWDEEIIEWKNKKFIVDHAKTIFNIPINFGKVMKNLEEKASKAYAKSSDCICLSNFYSKWNIDVYYAVDKEIQGIENTSISGRFFCKVYEGSYNEIDKWFRDFDKALNFHKLSSNKKFIWFTTCPKCAKKYGKNYVVILAQIC